MRNKNRNRNRRGNAGKTNAAAARDAEAHLPNRYRAPNFAPLIAAAVLVGPLFAGLGIFA